MNDFNDNGPYRYDPYSYQEPQRRRTGARTLALVVAVALVAGGSTYGVQSALNAQATSSLNQRIERLEQALSEEGQSLPVANYAVDNIAAPVSATSAGLSIPDIAEAVRPSIVGIKIVSSSRVRFGQAPGENTLSEGSGVIMSSDGYIMTNYHVIEYSKMDSANIKVVLSDEREFDAALVGGDQTTDLAVIKIETTGLSAAKMGSSAGLRAGEQAVAIGNPMGLEFAGSVTSGIISAVDRTIDVGDTSLRVIQTDAAINPGNSGGALLNSRGEVIGINTVKISTTGVEGLGFAIPIDEALPILNDLRQNGKVSGRPAIGISPATVDEFSARMYGYPLGVFVQEVFKDSAADKAGLQAGDVITDLDGQAIRSTNDINAVKAKHKVGDTVSLSLMRYNDVSGQYEKVDVSITFREAD